MIALVDYGAGNLTSVQLAFESLGIAAVPTRSASVLAQADHVVFPGVGAAASAMENLRAMGLIACLKDCIATGVPFLGICLGTQILFEHSEEDGGVETLGILPGTVRKFHARTRQEKIPHMGWNEVHWTRPHPVLTGVADGSDFYFVHSYYVSAGVSSDVFGETDYAGVRFASMVGRDNVVATQFHLEKSGRLGLQILQNFAKWDGRIDMREKSEKDERC